MTVPGGMSEWFRAPKRALVPLPAGLDPADASLVEPGSVAWHACHVAGVGPDTRVAVVGGGAIGILALIAAQAQGATDVAVEARHPHQREMVERFGGSETDGGQYDVVIEAAGSESGLHRSYELIRPRGTVALIGVYTDDIAWPQRAAFVKEAITTPALGYCGHDGVRRVRRGGRAPRLAAGDRRRADHPSLRPRRRRGGIRHRPRPGQRNIEGGGASVTSTTDPVVFDPYSIEYFDDPFPVYARLRDEAPVYHNEHYGFYALSRYQDVFDASTNWQTFTSTHGSTLSDLTNPDYRPGGMILNQDPPQHDRYRMLVNRAFTPRSIGEMEAVVRQVIVETLEPLRERTSFDAVAEFSALFPNEIISAILGIPAADRPSVRKWTDDMLSRSEGSNELSEVTLQAYLAQGRYFLGLVQDKRRNPADDMISHLLAAEIEDGEGGTTRLTDQEVADFSFILGAAGTETVTKLVGNAVVLLHRHRDQLQLLLDDRSRVPAAVEEILRYWAPSHLQGRFTTTDATVGGETIPAGNPVFLITGSANRDPRAYDDPDRFDITRTNLPAPLGLGRGIHFCVGAALARMESRVAIEELIARWPSFDVDEDGLRRVHMANVAGYSNVPVSVGTRS